MPPTPSVKIVHTGVLHVATSNILLKRFYRFTCGKVLKIQHDCRVAIFPSVDITHTHVLHMAKVMLPNRTNLDHMWMQKEH